MNKERLPLVSFMPEKILFATHEVLDANFQEFGSVFEGTAKECNAFIQKQPNRHNLVVRPIVNN